MPERVKQAGAIVARPGPHGPEVLLVSARKTRGDVVFPKGHLEAGETAEAAALREAREEAGVRGRVEGPAGTLSFQSGDEAVDVAYYLVRYEADVAADEARGARWLPLDAAVATLTHADARHLLLANAGRIVQIAGGRATS